MRNFAIKSQVCTKKFKKSCVKKVRKYAGFEDFKKKLKKISKKVLTSGVNFDKIVFADANKINFAQQRTLIIEQ